MASIVGMVANVPSTLLFQIYIL